MKQHILVVDDETQIRQLLGLYLERQGYQVSTAANASETLALLSQERVDLVVLDIGLAGEDGLKVLASIKRAHEQVRVVMLTGMGYVEDLLQEALQHGADGYVSKVMPLEDLVLTIRQILVPADSATPAFQVA
jgi:DNA-binding response OmpR family regulator